MRRRAFTLIELLVVISIIALLIGILLPALGAARATARSVKCLSNLKQIGVGLYAYSTDHHGHFPLNQLFANGNTATIPGWERTAGDAMWNGFLSEFGYCGSPLADDVTVKEASNVYICPETPDDAEFGPPEPVSWTDTRHLVVMSYGPNPRKGEPGSYQSSYLTNSAYFSSVAPWSGELLANHFPMPYVTIQTFVPGSPANQAFRWPKVDQMDDLSTLVMVGDGYQYTGSGPQRIHLRHAGETVANFAFGDGHAGSVAKEELPSGEQGAGNPFVSQAFLSKDDANYTSEQYKLTWAFNVPKP